MVKVYLHAILGLSRNEDLNDKIHERYDLFCKAWTDRGLVCSAKARIFNNMLYVRYVHLTKGQAYS
jgi:hypothetical protein